MPPYPAIHKCQSGSYRIGSGGCKFKTKQAAINAYEHWIKSKKNVEMDDWYDALRQDQKELVEQFGPNTISLEGI